MDIRFEDRGNWRRLAAVVALILLAATVSVGSAYAAPAPRPWDRTFKSLDEAAEAGAIDYATVTMLRNGKKVKAFAILDGDPVITAYGKGDKDGVAKAAAVIREMRETVLKRNDVTALQWYTLVPVALLSLTSESLALRLINDAYIRSIATDYVNELYVVNTLGAIRQPALGFGGADGRGVTVATLDTGAQFTVPDLGNCTAPGVPASCRVSAAVEIAPNDGSLDDNGHGTNIAAIASGVAPGARIAALDVSATGTSIADHDSLAGLDWVLANRLSRNIRAVNLSFGVNQHNNTICGDSGFGRNAYQWPFQMLRLGGVLPVVAVGNAARPGPSYTDGISYPACTRGAVPVGATFISNGGSQVFASCTDPSPTIMDTVPCFSQDSTLLDVLAPGVSVTGGGTTSFSGTSQAAAHVTGATAVVAQARPSSTSDELRSFLMTSSQTVLDSRSGRLHPRLDLIDAVRAAAPISNDNRAAARVLTGAGGLVRQTTWSATKEPGEPDHAGNPGGTSAWFQWTATQTGSATFSTDGSDFDTLLAVYRDVNGTLVELASSDNYLGRATSTVSLPLTAGETVLVAADGIRPTGGAFAASGQLTLTWNLPNDQISQAIPLQLAAAALVVDGSNVAATKQPGEPRHCGDQFSTASVWYQMSPPAGVPIRIRASGTRMLCVAAYSADGTLPVPSFNDLTYLQAEADDFGDPVDFTFTPVSGGIIWLAVDGVSIETVCNPQCFYTTPTGLFTLTIGGP